MAAPPSKTIKDLSGQWTMNKGLSGDFDSILAMQGVSWFVRRAISFATVTLSVKQYVNNDPSPDVTHIDITQTATGGIKGTTELRILDWTARDHKDGIFGEVHARSRWVTPEQLRELHGGSESEKEDAEYLGEGWLDEDGAERVLSWAESVGGGWTVEQVWGFQEVDGKRYYARNVNCRKGEEVKRARLVYDFHE
ncbi:hypothetical protein MMC25_000055 [Agyrium rufum]|nr:hypothetical protein [Agyrium rufum]